MVNYKFSNELNKEFSETLRSRVNAFFADNQISRKANRHMVIKTLTALSIYLIPYFLIVLGGFSSLPILFSLFLLMGFGTAFVGTSVMHDVMHGSYSSDKTINTLMRFSAIVIGVDPGSWNIEHNVLHHSYTNIEDADEDILPRYVMRFSPNQPMRWFHRYQYIYVLLFYTTTTLVWVFAKDYDKLIHFRKIGLVPSGAKFRKLMASLIFRKTMYYLLVLVLPIYLLPVSIGMGILLFVAMHLVAGITLSLIFQPAHVMPTSEYYEPEDNHIEHNWDVHQLLTTTNFGMNNKILTFFAGGLNFQNEHHLFPGVCHVHYPKIAKIVQATAKEFNVPYHAEPTFTSAVLSHFRMLWALGRFKERSAVKRALNVPYIEAA